MPENPLVKTALNKAMALCAGREYCSGDISAKLESWGLNDSEVNRVIGILIREDFINDKRYAEAFVRDKYHHNKWGKVKIASHLKAKKIVSDLIYSALASLDEDQYKQMVRDTIDSHRKHVKAKNQYDLKGKLLRFGLSKGFESNLLYDILNEIEGK